MAIVKRLSEIDSILEEVDATLEEMGVAPPEESVPPKTQELKETVLPYAAPIAQGTQTRMGPS